LIVSNVKLICDLIVSNVCNASTINCDLIVSNVCTASTIICDLIVSNVCNASTINCDLIVSNVKLNYITFDVTFKLMYFVSSVNHLYNHITYLKLNNEQRHCTTYMSILKR